MGKIFGNRWVKFSLVSIIYILLTVVWTGNLWMLPGVAVIYDIYISRWMYRRIWAPHKERQKKNKTYKVASEWIEAIVFAVVVVTLLRIFVFGMFVIPSSSMEKSLLVGDYLLVSKLAYGPSIPNTPIAFPLVHNTLPLSSKAKSYVEWPNWPYHRLKGWGRVQRGDAVVFNFPAGDTVILEMLQSTYYDVVRDAQAMLGKREGYDMVHKNYTVLYRPVDRRENYVKRCVGVPGDTIRIVKSELMVNGQPFRDIPKMQFFYRIRTNGQEIAAHRFEEMEISHEDRRFDGIRNNSFDGSEYVMPLTRENAEKIRGMGNVLSVEQVVVTDPDHNIFPHDTLYRWSVDDFGPLWIPKKGVTVPLNRETIPFYREIIGKYEGNQLFEKDGIIYINGTPSDSYTFRMDYYFMMGDNRHNSADSRFWGFVPEDHVVGKASFIWFSVNPDKSFFSGIRWGRMFRSVK